VTLLADSLPSDAAAIAVPWLVLGVLSVVMLAPVALMVIYFFRPGSRWNWGVAVGGGGLAWLGVLVITALVKGGAGTYMIPLQSWNITPEFPFSTMLLIDQVSWPFAAATVTLVMSVLLTAVMRPTPMGWYAWGGSLAIGGLALLAVWAGNPLTLLLAWAAIDILEAIVIHIQVRENAIREGISASLAARFGGLAVLILVILLARSRGVVLAFDNIPDFVNPYLLVTAGLRLGVLPLQLPFLSEPPLRRGVGTVLRLVPAISALTLLVRIASTPAPQNLLIPLLSLSALAALYSGISWLTAEDELSGRAFWILGMAALAVGSAVRGDPAGSMAWGLAMLYAGAQLFLYSARFAWLEPVMFLGVLGISMLPFSPSWPAARLLASGLWPEALPFIIIGLLFFTANFLLLIGYIRHFRRSIPPQTGFEPLTRLVYVTGLLLLPLSHWIFYFLYGIPDWRTVPTAMWWTPLISTGLAISVWVFYRQDPLFLLQQGSFRGGLNWSATFWGKLLSLKWLYLALFEIYRRVGRFFDALGRLLEGDGGVLWALLLLLLLYSLSVSTLGNGGGF